MTTTYDLPVQELVPSAVRTTSGNQVLAGLFNEVRGVAVTLDITAGAGGNLTVTVENSKDNGASWQTVDTFPVQTAPANVKRTVPVVYAGLTRISWVISAGSFTFSVAVLQDRPRRVGVTGYA